jgi:hypothetical protein
MCPDVAEKRIITGDVHLRRQLAPKRNSIEWP